MAEIDLSITRWPLPWQADLWHRVNHQLQQDHLPHALLLAGPAGVGKRRFAQTLALALLCQQPLAEGYACGVCRSCHFVGAGNHPDLLWLAPEEAGKAIKIDQVRRAASFVAQTAQQGGRQVVVVEPVEALNRFAANALLKTLEEPAGDTQLLLVTDAPGRLLPTIRSRCQRLDFPVPAPALSTEWLRPMAGDDATVARLMDESDGRPMIARGLLDDNALAGRIERADALLQFLEGKLSALALAQRWKDEDLGDLLTWLISRLLSGLRTGMAAHPATDPLNARLAELTPVALLQWIDAAQSVLTQHRSGSNPNRQLALESILLRLGGGRAPTP